MADNHGDGEKSGSLDGVADGCGHGKPQEVVVRIKSVTVFWWDRICICDCITVTLDNVKICRFSVRISGRCWRHPRETKQFHTSPANLGQIPSFLPKNGLNEMDTPRRRGAQVAMPVPKFISNPSGLLVGAVAEMRDFGCHRKHSRQ
jgi:hypothetical protein